MQAWSAFVQAVSTSFIIEGWECMAHIVIHTADMCIQHIAISHDRPLNSSHNETRRDAIERVRTQFGVWQEEPCRFRLAFSLVTDI